MPDLRVNNVDQSLLAQLKAEAALAGVYLRDYILGILINRPQPKGK